jgi:hypothetical protein
VCVASFLLWKWPFLVSLGSSWKGFLMGRRIVLFEVASNNLFFLSFYFFSSCSQFPFQALSKIAKGLVNCFYVKFNSFLLLFCLFFINWIFFFNFIFHYSIDCGLRFAISCIICFFIGLFQSHDLDCEFKRLAGRDGNFTQTRWISTWIYPNGY